MGVGEMRMRGVVENEEVGEGKGSNSFLDFWAFGLSAGVGPGGGTSHDCCLEETTTVELEKIMER
jgi:hypothetical protein